MKLTVNLNEMEEDEEEVCDFIDVVQCFEEELDDFRFVYDRSEEMKELLTDVKLRDEVEDIIGEYRRNVEKWKSMKWWKRQFRRKKYRDRFISFYNRLYSLHKNENCFPQMTGRTWNVPYFPSLIPRLSLRGRFRELEEHQSESTTVIAVCGDEGAGKTRFVVDLMNSFEGRRVCIFFNGWNEELLRHEMIEFGQFMGINSNAGESDVIEWLSSTERWIVVIDDIVNYEEVMKYVPSKGGIVLITSRRRDERWENVIDVKKMTSGECAEMSQRIIGGIADESDVQQLVKLLDFVPISVCLACGVIEDDENDCNSVGKYIKLYKQTKSKRFGEENIDSVYLSVEISLNQLENEGAFDVMMTIGWLMPKFIPQSLLRLYSIRNGNNDDSSVERWLLKLLRLSLVSYVGDDGKYFVVNSNVSEAVRRRDVSKKWLFNALLLLKLAVEESLCIEEKRILVIHGLYLFDMIKSSNNGMNSAKLMDIASFFGDCVGYTVLYAMKDARRAVKLYEYVLKIQESVYYSEHCEIANTLIHLSNAFALLREYENALPLLERSLPIVEKNYSEGHVIVGMVFASLGKTLCVLRQDLSKQLYFLEHALHIFEESFGSNDLNVANVLINLATANEELGNTEKELGLLKRALPVFVELYGEDHLKVARIMSDAGSAYHRLGFYKQAKHFLKKSLTVKRIHCGENQMETVVSMELLAKTYGCLEKKAKKLMLLERSLSVKQLLLGSSHHEVASSKVELGEVNAKMGNIKIALSLLEEARPILEGYYGMDNIKTIPLLSYLGKLYAESSEYEKQRVVLQQALAIQESRFGSESVKITETLLDLSDSYCSLNELGKQRECLERVLDIREKHHGHRHAEVAKPLVKLGSMYSLVGENEKEILVLERSLRIMESSYGVDSCEVAQVLVNLGEAYGFIKNYENQYSVLVRALPVLEKNREDGHEMYDVLISLGISCGKLGEVVKEKEYLERAMCMSESKSDTNKKRLSKILLSLSDSYGSLGLIEKKISVLNRCLTVLEEEYGENHIKVGICLKSLGDVYGLCGDYEMLLTLFGRSLPIFVSSYGEQHEEVGNMLITMLGRYGITGNKKKRMEILERILKIERSRSIENEFDFGVTISNIANSFGIMGEYKRQNSLLIESFVIFKEHCGPSHCEVATLLAQLGRSWGKVGEFEKERACLLEALNIQKKNFPENCSEEEIFVTSNYLGNCYGSLKDVGIQKELSENDLRVQEGRLGRNHFQVSLCLDNLGNAYGDLAQPRVQKRMLERSLSIKEDCLVNGLISIPLTRVQNSYILEDYPYVQSVSYQQDLASTLVKLSRAYGNLGYFSNKKSVLSRAYHVMEKCYGPEHCEVKYTSALLGDSYTDMGDPRKAYSLINDALPVVEEFYGENHVYTAELLKYLSRSCERLRRTEEREALLLRVFDIQKRSYFSKSHHVVVATRVALAGALRDNGHFNEARKILQEAVRNQERRYGSGGHFAVSVGLLEMGRTEIALGNVSEGRELLEKVVAIQRSHYGQHHVIPAETEIYLSEALRGRDSSLVKRYMLEHVLTVQERHYGKIHVEVARTLERIAQCLGDEDISAKINFLQQAVAMKKMLTGDESSEVAQTLVNLSAAYEDAGEEDKKIEILEEAKRMMDKTCVNE